MGGYPYNLLSGAANPGTLVGAGLGTSSIMDQRECYVNCQFELRLYNPGTTSMTFEVYACKPREVTRNSPLYDVQACHEALIEESGSYDVDARAWKFIGRSPNDYTVFRKMWKTQKRTFVVVPGSMVTVRVGVPMSRVQYSMLKKLENGATFCSAPGLTQWLWVRAYGCFGGDTTTGMIATAQPVYWCQLWQNVNVLQGVPEVKKRLDVRNFNTASSINIDEKLAQDDVNTGS